MRGILANGVQIRSLRKAQAMTQEDLASRADLDVKTIRKAETKKQRVDLSVLVAIADALGIAHQSISIDDQLNVLTPEQLIALVHQWNDAWLRCDIDAIVSMHTEDTVMVLPGTEDFPDAKNSQGLEELRVFLTNLFPQFQISEIDQSTLQIDVSGNHVFQRTNATITHVPSGRAYTTRHVHEIEFRGDKIAHRITVADYDLLRKIHADISADQQADTDMSPAE
ncbi:RNA polymerase factor sigma-70 [Rubripirellula obstinata]|uniref:RNA polymerase factor sigma-70 n=1 Tax=Rubripirellula obstinata TaxID=406547 RepID=A0A5B1CIN3_9BACT|nr:nuclear transport factor 2 family protein [Rubripirellula obstinata]KAA1260456.1 RNA polymerase factor sigma-70 [Rubripirellula obstinata]